MLKMTAAASLVAALLAADAAQAYPAGIQPTLAQGHDARLQTVQYGDRCYGGERISDCRERLRWERRHGRHYEWRDGRYYDRRYRDRDDDAGAAIAGAILGFALGAAIQGSQSDYDHYYSNRDNRSWRARCAARYRSFDWRTGTYLSRDGYRRYCRL